MTRYYDDDDARVKADRLHEINKGEAVWLHKKGLNVKSHRLMSKTRMMRDKTARDDIAFKQDIARRQRDIPITLPKLGVPDAGD